MRRFIVICLAAALALGACRSGGTMVIGDGASGIGYKLHGSSLSYSADGSRVAVKAGAYLLEVKDRNITVNGEPRGTVSPGDTIEFFDDGSLVVRRRGDTR